MTSPATRPSKLILVVLYRRSLADAPTVRSLRALGTLSDDDAVLIWDNSPEAVPAGALEAASAGSPARWTYHHTPENRSLAYIYNNAPRLVPGKGFLLIFDHDSKFGEDYFRELDAAALAEPEINLFVPLVRQADRIVSPGHFRYVKGSLWMAPAYGRQPAANTVVIGSGMAIRSRFLRDFEGFDERLQLYGVDSNFMLRYARQNRFFYVMDVAFGHDMAEYQAHDPATLWRRFRAFEYATRINAELFSWPVRVLTHLFLAYKKMALRRRTGSTDRQHRDV